MATVVLREYERAVVRVNGRVDRVLAGGRHRLPLARPGRSVEVQRLDLRLRWTLLIGQEVMTADVPGVRVSVAGQWRIADPIAFLDAAHDPVESLRLGLQLAVRDAFAERDLADVTAARPELAENLLARVSVEAGEVGVEVQRVEVRDVSPPGEVRRAVLAVHTARQEGLAALERARGETAALRALANGARVLADHPALLQLRTAEATAAAGGTVVFGVPVTAQIPP